MDDPETCGQGLAQHSALPRLIAQLLNSLAANLEAHMPTIDVATSEGQHERMAYDSLAQQYRTVASHLTAAAEEMLRYRELPMAPHHDAAFANPAIPTAFAEFVRIEQHLLAMLQSAASRDQRMLDAMHVTPG